MGESEIKKPALFLHIQKTAGTSIVDLAAEHYGNHNISAYADYFDKNPIKFQRTRFVSGHFGYDFARHIISNRYSFTFLRKPADRILSFYYFCLNQNPKEFEIYETTQENTLEQFLTLALESPDNYSHIWNNQVWMLAHGWGGNKTISDYTEEELLALSIQHLNEFDFIGFTETFDHDIKIILKALGISKKGSIRKSNVTKNKHFLSELPTSTRKLLDQLTELDTRLYEHARAHRAIKGLA